MEFPFSTFQILVFKVTVFSLFVDYKMEKREKIIKPKMYLYLRVAIFKNVTPKKNEGYYFTNI